MKFVKNLRVSKERDFDDVVHGQTQLKSRHYASFMSPNMIRETFLNNTTQYPSSAESISLQDP
jgi:hypothetical protein